jgi:membrane-bound ClpP family serine protease
MPIFLAIAIGAFILIVGSFVFGHDHDIDDADHDGGTTVGEHTISIFSMKVVGTFLMGFGGAGAIMRNYDYSYMTSSLSGIGTGLALGGLMWLFLSLISKQQASSLIDTSSLVGASGVVTVSISEATSGEVGVTYAGRYMNFAAAAGGRAIPKGKTVRVVKNIGSQLIVEEA